MLVVKQVLDILPIASEEIRRIKRLRLGLAAFRKDASQEIQIPR